MKRTIIYIGLQLLDNRAEQTIRRRSMIVLERNEPSYRSNRQVRSFLFANIPFKLSLVRRDPPFCSFRAANTLIIRPRIFVHLCGESEDAKMRKIHVTQIYIYILAQVSFVL